MRTSLKKNAYIMAAMLAMSALTACSSKDQADMTQVVENVAGENTDGSSQNVPGEAGKNSEQQEGQQGADEENQESAYVPGAETTTPETALTEAEIEITDTVSNDEDEGHAIEADGEEASYSNIKVSKTGEAEGDEADFYGANAAVFATNGASLDLDQIIVETDGTHANGVFSYGEGTIVNISNSVISTSGNCSGGIMTTGGGTMNASNLTIHTTGNSSASIRSDRGGGTVVVNGGSYTTDGTGSPAIYSTADITVNDSYLESTSSQGIVVEGKNSVTLNNSTVIADNNTKNSDKSEYYQAVMIYQSMSGDAANGEAVFTMNGGSMTNKNGDIFFINNTVATINLDGAEITNESDGVFLRAAAAGWGNEGSNGGQVTLNASNQSIDGDMVVDEVSNLNLYLTDESTFSGAINSSGAAGEVFVSVDDGSVWRLTGDSYITSLSCGESSIDLNGYTLYVDGEAYVEGSASSGTAIEVTVTEGNGGPGGAGPNGAGGPGGSGDGKMTPPDGEAPSGAPEGMTPPDGEAPSGAPEGEASEGGAPEGMTPPDGSTAPGGAPGDGNLPSGDTSASSN